MTIEQKLFSKLEPHAKRIKDGEGNDFDYLPAVLLQLLEEQKRQAKLLDDTAKLLDSIKNTAGAIGVQSKAQITAFESAAERKMEQMETGIKDTQTQLQNAQSSMSEQISVAQRKMEQMETGIKDTQTQLQNAQSSMSEQISVLASANAADALQTKEGLGAIGLKIESFANSTQQTHAKAMRLLIAGLVSSTAMIGLVVAILLRH